jgi:putative oxidoreductase
VNLRGVLATDPTRFASVALLIVRVATGVVLAPHGWYKLVDGAQRLSGGLAAKGWPIPYVLAWCATLVELLGAALLIAGLFTRPAAALVSLTMIVAWSSSHLEDLPKIGAAGGAAFEYPFLLSMTALAIALAGPGRLSADAALEGRVRR